MATPKSTTVAVSGDELATGAAHDLRNVLLVIAAHCSKLAETLDEGDPRADEVRAMGEAVDRGVALARQMVTSARDQDTLRLVDVNATVHGLLPLLRRLVGDRIDVLATLGHDVWPITANAVQVEQIVMNLAVNARDAMPAGGRLTITTENRLTAGAGGQLSPFVVISVADTGTGIASEDQSKVFDPFFTTRADAGGSGVGLATVRAITLLHGGHVELSSSPGAGTVFRVAFPRSPADWLTETVDAEAGTEGQAKRILLVENERAIRDFLARCLAAEGYDVRAAANGQEALHLCGPRSHIDLIVTDVNLPDVNGPDVVRHIREQMPDVRVMFMTGGPDTVRSLEKGGGFPVLAKPFSTAELVSAVRRALAAE
jgi:two-component system, cell cycle sensor histidine kinase and response regulator CckA